MIYRGPVHSGISKTRVTSIGTMQQRRATKQYCRAVLILWIKSLARQQTDETTLSGHGFVVVYILWNSPHRQQWYKALQILQDLTHLTGMYLTATVFKWARIF